jgi:DNA (cytosine-5)-methyltransferase 1
VNRPTIVDLFAGPGGWSLGLRQHGLEDIGVELDSTIADTRELNGLATVRADVRDIPEDYWGQIDGLIASPPCQTFSQAGKMRGLDDARGELVYEPKRFIEKNLPLFVAFEEVPQVLPIWNEYAAWMDAIGYRVWTGILNAADYGVPQSRKRAFLLARRDGKSPSPKDGTHSKSESRDQFMFGNKPMKWVTAAEALPHRTDLPEWASQRPATTIVRSFCPHVVSAPGYRKKGDGPRQKAPGSFEVSLEEMATLQGVPSWVKFAGSKTKRFSVCGAFLPPPWAAAVLENLVDSVTKDKNREGLATHHDTK